MTTVLAILVIVLAVLAICMLVWNVIMYRAYIANMADLTDKLEIAQVEGKSWENTAKHYEQSRDTWRAAAEAFESGIDEQAESYEMQFLSFNEKIAALEHQVSYVDDELEEARKVIADHDENCLPAVQLRFSEIE